MLTSGRRRVLFWYWHSEDSSFHFYSPALQSKAFKQKIGDITTSLFLPQSTKALSGNCLHSLPEYLVAMALFGSLGPRKRTFNTFTARSMFFRHERRRRSHVELKSYSRRVCLQKSNLYKGGVVRNCYDFSPAAKMESVPFERSEKM